MTQPINLRNNYKQLDDILGIIEQQKARRVQEIERMFSGDPMPDVPTLLAALREVDFLKQRQILSRHPGFVIFERLSAYERSFRVLLSFYDDLTAAKGRFHGIALTQTGLNDALWDDVSFSFSKCLFAFAAAAKACDEMLGRFCDRRIENGRVLVDAARSEWLDRELVAFVHKLRDHLSHNILEMPAAGMHWSVGDLSSVETSVVVEAERFNTSRWNDDEARKYLGRSQQIDLMAVATAYIRESNGVNNRFLKEFWGSIGSAGLNFISLKGALEANNNASSWSIWVQILDQKPEIDPLRFLHQHVPEKYLGQIRGMEPYSEQQFEAIARVVDPLGTVNDGLKERLKRRFLAGAEV